MIFDRARQIADAVLYEGYLLYPYHAAAAKNQVRWQFGVLAPRAVSQDTAEPWFAQTECLIEPGAAPVLRLKMRFLQLQARTVQRAAGERFRRVETLDVDGTLHTAWDEGTAREVDATAAIRPLLAAEQIVPFHIPGGREVEPIRTRAGELAGRVARRRWPLSGVLRLAAEIVAGSPEAIKIRVRIENTAPVRRSPARRDVALRRSLIATHTLLAVSDGAFISLIDPPAWAQAAAAACANLQTWPVLVGAEGQRDVMLSSPIILYDYPAIAPESPGDLFDATEIDEILTLRTMTLTDEEKRAARATDERGAAIIDRAETMPAAMLERLHGAVRYLRAATAAAPPEAKPPPWWDPAADPSVSPGMDTVQIDGVVVAKGSRVRLRPGSRRADAQDMFLAGRIATVEAVLADVDDRQYLAVALVDDPAADLHRAHGRFLYFSPDEVEPLEESR